MIISIVSGYFNPLHLGHLKMIREAKGLADKLIVIVNNDVQQKLKKGKIIMNEDERVEIVSALRDVDEVILSVDQDGTQVKTIEDVARKYVGNTIIFCNGGDRNSVKEIPEGEVCLRYGIEMKFGVGGNYKQNSSSTINVLLGKE